jgi:uncharacterized protein (DUF433 family)
MERIERNPRILLGKPVIKGTRITVEQILEDLAGGASVDSLLDDFPSLVEADIRAALAYAAESVRGEPGYRVAQ